MLKTMNTEMKSHVPKGLSPGNRNFLNFRMEHLQHPHVLESTSKTASKQGSHMAGSSELPEKIESLVAEELLSLDSKDALYVFPWDRRIRHYHNLDMEQLFRAF